MSLLALILILLILCGGVGWHRYDYYGGPYLGGGVGLVLIILLILALIGKI